jgi:ParB-like nuclease family protein
VTSVFPVANSGAGGTCDEASCDGLCAASAPALVSIESLVAADSPRLSGENDDHVRVLAESDAVLPPLIVHRSTMRVIDGMHRLRAARLKGEHTVLVRFFDGDEDEAFLLAVKTNVTHGLPLTSADRNAAAKRIIEAQPEWSDRAIASATKLSAKTVAAIRARSTAEHPQLNRRRGRDGRVRPLNAAEGRRRAGELITARPDASLREIARAAGISPSTVRDVRDRLLAGEEPAPAQRNNRRTPQDDRETPEERLSEHNRDPVVLISRLRKDPSLRFNEGGRTLLRLLDAHPVERAEWRRLVDSVPAHCTNDMWSLAKQQAGRWREFAEWLNSRGHDT